MGLFISIKVFFVSQYPLNYRLINNAFFPIVRPGHWELLLLLPSKRAVVIVDPFQLDRATDVSTNFLR